MNIFTKIALDERGNDAKLGMPSTDEGHRQRRLDLMSAIRQGNGFRKIAASPKKDNDGLTRGQRKRAARNLANSKVSEFRDRKFRHASGANVEYVDLQVAA